MEISQFLKEVVEEPKAGTELMKRLKGAVYTNKNDRQDKARVGDLHLISSLKALTRYI